MVTGWVLGNFAKADQDWLPGLLDAIAAAADKLVAGDDAGFMNEVALLTQAERAPAGKTSAPAPAARPKPAGPTESAKNAMAETLKKLLAMKRPPPRRP